MVLALLLLAAASFSPVRAPFNTAHAQDRDVPVFLDLDAVVRRPVFNGQERIRFLTTVDFPPFNFVGQTGQLSGFNVDVARAICEELRITAQCQIQALPWGELEPALTAGQGEAVIAGWPINRRLRTAFAFSDTYLQLPARFVRRLQDGDMELTPRGIARRRIGVIDASAHEAMLRAYFPTSRAVVYQRASWMFDDLKAGKIDAVFGDGMELSFWLSGQASDGCCRFIGGPYLSRTYLGEGMAIAVPRDRDDLAQAFTFALRALMSDGRFAEIFRRYFPRNFY